MKKTIIAVIVVVLIALGGYFLFERMAGTPEVPENQNGAEGLPGVGEEGQLPTEEENKAKEVIGTSVEGRPIEAYHFGEGETELLFVGGIHGGYEWNTALVAYELVDYLRDNPEKVPAGIRVSVIPVLNPDGLAKVVGTSSPFEASDVSESDEVVVSGRFNANNVDLNRNFDCDWQENATWQNKTVSGGDAAFSEPESRAFRDYVAARPPEAVVVWYSAAGGVFASNCHGGVLPETSAITKVFSDASGYPAYEDFDFYEITGDMVNWLAKNKVPAISILLTNHSDTEWAKNRAGIEALFERYAE